MTGPGGQGVAPSTGDAAVDRILADLDRRLEHDEAGQVESVAEAHRLLQARLNTEQAPPDQARPGPR